MILRRLSQGLRAQDWSVISLELIVLILGVFIGLQVDDWNAARKERAEERDYLVRLLDDSDKNLASISREEGRLEHLRVSILRSMEILEGSTLVDEDYESVQFALCRWYIDPALAIERGTYSELVSSGRLGLLSDTKLRDQLETTNTLHTKATRQQDLFGSKIVSLSETLDPARTWYAIDSHDQHRCDIDWDLLRQIPGASSVLAQLYFSQSRMRRERQEQLREEQNLNNAILCNLERKNCAVE